MKKIKTWKPKIGVKVYVRGLRKEGIRIIDRILDDYDYGAVMLNEPVSGIRFWNTQELVKFKS